MGPYSITKEALWESADTFSVFNTPISFIFLLLVSNLEFFPHSKQYRGTGVSLVLGYATN